MNFFYDLEWLRRISREKEMLYVKIKGGKQGEFYLMKG